MSEDMLEVSEQLEVDVDQVFFEIHALSDLGEVVDAQHYLYLNVEVLQV